MDLEGLQVQILLVAQVGHGELADAVQVLDVAAGREGAVVRRDGLAGNEIVGNVLDVLAVVGGFGPLGVTGLEAFGAQLGAVGQRGDLHAGVVVIELAVHLPALRGEQVADRVAQSGLAPVADVQRAGRVGRDELDQHAFVARRLEAEARPRLQHRAHDLLLGRRLEPDVDEAGAGDVDVRNPALVSRQGQQGGTQSFGQLARVEPERLGQLHRGGAGEVAVGGHLGRLEGSLGASAGGELFQRVGQRREQFLFD
jgi:hypothetical protein